VKKSNVGAVPIRTITPISQIVNIAFFALFALITRYFAAVLLQCAVIGMSLLLCRGKLIHLPARQFLPILPIVGFVLVLNSFRGTGEVLLRFGPFVVVKQGILRGVYYTAIIVQLWFMSKVLTISYTEEDLMRAVSAFSRNRKSSGVVLILYYIFKIFHNTYSELGVVFKGGVVGKGGKKRIRERVVLFFNSAFEKSKGDFDRLSGYTPAQMGSTAADFFYMSFEAGVLLASFLMRNVFVRL
jgi:hypothetical protein